jgi:hypothetical protein
MSIADCGSLEIKSTPERVRVQFDMSQRLSTEGAATQILIMGSVPVGLQSLLPVQGLTLSEESLDIASSTLFIRFVATDRSVSREEIARLSVEYLRSVTYKSRTFFLKRPVRCQIELHQGVWSHTCSELKISSYGLTEEESWADFCMQFAASWDAIAVERDDKLTSDAQDLKRLLTDLVTAVR